MKKNQSKSQALKGFKVVAPPKNPDRRRLIQGEELTASGGARVRKAAHP